MAKKVETFSFLDFPLERSNHTMRRKMEEHLTETLEYLKDKSELTDDEADMVLEYSSKLNQLKKYKKKLLQSENYKIG